MELKIYVIKLCQEKFYVGISNNIKNRIRQHTFGHGSQWTKKYKFKSLVIVKKQMSPFDEDLLTKKYMLKYGIENVRGGSYSSPNLTILQLMALQNEFDTATNKCFNCGMKLTKYHKCAKEDLNTYQEILCYYCGKVGHRINDCYKLKCATM